MPQAISRRIVITDYDGISLLDLAGPLEAFRVGEAPQPCLAPAIHTGDYGHMSALHSISIPSRHQLLLTSIAII
jgi:hypothetical protein